MARAVKSKPKKKKRTPIPVPQYFGLNQEDLDAFYGVKEHKQMKSGMERFFNSLRFPDHYEDIP